MQQLLIISQIILLSPSTNTENFVEAHFYQNDATVEIYNDLGPDTTLMINCQSCIIWSTNNISIGHSVSAFSETQNVGVMCIGIIEHKFFTLLICWEQIMEHVVTEIMIFVSLVHGESRMMEAIVIITSWTSKNGTGCIIGNSIYVCI